MSSSDLDGYTPHSLGQEFTLSFGEHWHPDGLIRQLADNGYSELTVTQLHDIIKNVFDNMEPAESLHAWTAEDGHWVPVEQSREFDKWMKWHAFTNSNGYIYYIHLTKPADVEAGNKVDTGYQCLVSPGRA